MKKPIILIVLFLIIGSVLYAYKMYNKPHTDVGTTDAAETLSAEDIFKAFDNDEAAAMLKYSDKVIAVEGILLSKDLSNELEPQIVLDGNGYDGYIRCGFKPEMSPKIVALAENNPISIKGICVGMNGSEELDLLADKDVVLSNCILID
jgi:hypothetical protein